MSSNGHVVAATWSAADFDDLELLNEPMLVDIFEGKRPPVLLDPRGYEMLAFMGDTGDPLIRDAVAAYETQSRRFNQAGTTETWVDRAPEVRAVQDKILAAILLTPKYCPQARLINGRPPSGHLWYGSFTGDQRRKLVDFFYSGVDALKSVRAAARPNEPAVSPGDGVSPASEQHPDSASAPVGAVVAGQRDAVLADGAGPGGEIRGRPIIDIREA